MGDFRRLLALFKWVVLICCHQLQDCPRLSRDTALLLLTALSVVGVLLCAFFIKPLSVLVSSRVGIAAIILVVGGGLTFIFNRRGAPHQ
jgi:hypothetical protein